MLSFAISAVAMLSILVRLMRVKQWLKNLMLFFPPFLGGVLLFQNDLVVKGIVPFLAFSCASSATYIVNDVRDVRTDMKHPVKKFRPLPAGHISSPAALMLALVLAGMALMLSLNVGLPFSLLLLLYCVISLSYSFWLKNVPIVDLFCISAGFLFRLHAGGLVFGVTISEWLFLSVFLLALFLSTGKRLSEKNTLGAFAGEHRKSLAGYPNGFLDGAMYMTGSAVLVTYTMYVISRHSLVYTVPLCCFGLMRYIFRVQSGQGGDPTESLTRDVPLFVTAILWVFTVGWGIYGGR